MISLDWSKLECHPICSVLDEVRSALESKQRAVLSSPTGSGKSTVLPLALLNESYLKGRKIIILEPRRIAAYAVASQLARNLGEEVGMTVGYRMRLDSKVSDKTVIEVLTEGMLARKLQNDPELSDTAVVIFDEFHERSLQADLALALCLDTAESLRDDLRILLMSATLESQKVAELLGNAPVIESQGRAYPVENKFFPRRTDLSLSENIAKLVQEAYVSETGSMLVFLPGEWEIKAVENILQKTIIDPSCHIIPLYGRLNNSLQRQAIEAPKSGERKIVLATAIAESSLTIDGVRIVIDSGFTKIARYQPGSNLERLETVPISQAAAIQRAGRAGRTEPGVAWKLWSEYEDARREEMRPSQMSYCDLSNMLLELAAWGVSNPADLRFMEPPPEVAWQSAIKYLQSLKVIDKDNKLTSVGKLVHASGLGVRAGFLIAIGEKLGMAQSAVKVASLLESVDTRRNNTEDIAELFNQFEAGNKHLSTAVQLANKVKSRLRKYIAPADKEKHSIGALLAAAYPERVARRRGALGELCYLTCGGKAAAFREMVNLSGSEFIVAINLDDRADNAMIQLAASVEAWELEEFLTEHFTERINLKIDPSDLSVEATRSRMLGAIVWNRSRGGEFDRMELCAELAKVIRKQSLNILHLPPSVIKLQEKISFILKNDPDCGLPELSDQYILEHIEELLLTFLPEKISKNMLKSIDWHQAVYSLLDYNQQRELSRLLPEKIRLENNREFKIDYSCDPPAVEGKLQWFFGVRKQPSLLNGKLPLVVRLLSPAGRPVQTTGDIGNFWQGSYKLVRNELKGRYPKHDWPENP